MRRAAIPAVAWNRRRRGVPLRRRDWWAVAIACLLVPGIALIVHGVRSIQLVPPLERVAGPVAPLASAEAVVVSSTIADYDPLLERPRAAAKPRKKARPAAKPAPAPSVTVVVTTPPEPAAEPPVVEAAPDGRAEGHAEAYAERDVARSFSGERQGRTHGDQPEDEGRHAGKPEQTDVPTARAETHG
jgi:hypothetical protein